MPAHSGRPLPPADAREVADGVFAYIQPDGSWWINNTGFVVGSDQVCVIDSSSTETRTRAFREAISRRSAAPVRTLINTHHHGDHTNGNCLFGESVVVGHVNCRDNMQGQTIGGLDLVFEPVEWGDLTVVRPALTFEDRLGVHVDDLLVEAVYVGGPAHTTGDVAVWVPDRGVLFAGDLVFNGGTPFMLMGSIAGSLQAIGLLRALGADTVVPGHGGVCGPEGFTAVEDYLLWVQRVAAAARAAELTPLEAARQTDLGQWSDLLDAERIVGNLHRAYMELDGLPPGAPADIVSAFTDMITYNGGRPLSCRA